MAGGVLTAVNHLLQFTTAAAITWDHRQHSSAAVAARRLTVRNFKLCPLGSASIFLRTKKSWLVLPPRLKWRAAMLFLKSVPATESLRENFSRKHPKQKLSPLSATRRSQPLSTKL